MPETLAESDWQSRVDVFDGAGYSRIDEKTATQIVGFNDYLIDT